MVELKKIQIKKKTNKPLLRLVFIKTYQIKIFFQFDIFFLIWCDACEGLIVYR